MLAGDWTRELHDAVRRPTRRPVWISGPFASPYSTAINYDNLILVASGIGITPALSIISAHKETRRINLVWICRDPALLEDRTRAPVHTFCSQPLLTPLFAPPLFRRCLSSTSPINELIKWNIISSRRSRWTTCSTCSWAGPRGPVT